MTTSQKKRVVAIGMGPFNLGFAALSQPVPDVEVTVLEARESFEWHPGMLLPHTQLQVPFIADLVTFADPTSNFSFLNYLKVHGRLHQFYIRQSWYPLRSEYSHYCRWVAEQLPGINYETTVTEVRELTETGELEVVSQTPNGTRRDVCDAVLVGTGTQPTLPAALQTDDPRVLHTADYMHRRDDILGAERVVVVGSGQSAAEAALDILQSDVPNFTWVTRSPRFFGMEVGPLTLELTSPDYQAHFSRLSEERQAKLNKDQIPLYRGISEYTLTDIYNVLYEREIQRRTPPQIWANTAVTGCEAMDTGVTLSLRDSDTDATGSVSADIVVCGTGYTFPGHDFLKPVSHLVVGNSVDDAKADLDHTIDADHQRIFVNNTAQQPHGLTTTDLGMAPLRSAQILRALLGRPVYLEEQRIAYQTFGAMAGAPK